MSFKCVVTSEIVENKKKVLVPVLKRKVHYQKVVRRRDKDGTYSDVEVGLPSEGWEVATEFPTTVEHSEKLTKDFENNFESEIKTVYLSVSSQILNKEKEKRKEQENKFSEYMDL